MDKQILKTEERKTVGRKVKTLRSKGILPANIYGKKVKSLSVQLSKKDFLEVFKKVGETGLVELSLGKEKRPVLIHNVQRNPVTDDIIHADFLQVDLKEKVIATVPVVVLNESPAEKSGLGTVVQQVDEVEVEALPQDLPDRFEVDASELLQVDQAVLIKDLKYDKKKIELKVSPDQIVVKVEPPQKEEIVTPPTPAEVPAAVEEKAEEAEEVKEGVPSEPKPEATKTQ